VLAAVALAAASVLATAAPAATRQPVFVNDLTPATDAPLLEDGTVAFAVLGTLSAPGRAASVRAAFAAGDPLLVELAVPDLPPERDLPGEGLPRLVVTHPSGAVTELRPDRRDPLPGPAPDTGLLRLTRQEATAAAGVYTFTVTGQAASRFAVLVGTRDGPGVVAGYTEPPAGALEAWSRTPPPDEATLGGPASPPPAAGGPGGRPDLDVARLAGDPVADATPGRAAGLPLGLAAVAILAVVVAAVIRGRRARPGRAT
jgi:hypothetical protein